jgi:hypothetical protein
MPVSLIAAVLWASPAVTHAELRVVEERTGYELVQVFQMSVTPAPEPVPALRERLTVRDIEMQPGNAATHYLRLFPQHGLDAKMRALAEKHGETFYEEFTDWYYPGSAPLRSLPLDKMRDAATSFDGEINNFVVPATVRRDCDWGLGLETMRGPEIIQVLLPEFQASRELSRVLALRARVAIADGDYQRAIDELRMNYRLAENVGSERLLVCSLIGLAETAIGHGVTLELMAAENSPNLYWALAELPDPSEALKRSIQFELSIAHRVFPILKDAETAQHAPEEWARLLTQTVQNWGQLEAQMPRMAPELMQASMSAMMVVAYPLAKQRLIDSGMDATRVESMPVAQVIVVDAAHDYQRIADAVEKRMYEPFHIARQRSDLDLFGSSKGIPFVTNSFGTILAQMLLPAVHAARSAGVRTVRQTRAMQIIEAMRMHAAEHGTLPASLDEIKVVAVPLNPVTNQPFVYHVTDGRAILELPASDGLGDASRFEIALEK